MVNSASGITHCFFWKGFNSFFNTRLTIVTEIRSTIFNSISLSDNIFNSHLGLSFGGDWYNKAVRWASTHPPIFLSLRVLRGFMVNISISSWQNWRRTRSIVFIETPIISFKMGTFYVQYFHRYSIKFGRIKFFSSTFAFFNPWFKGLTFIRCQM